MAAQTGEVEQTSDKPLLVPLEYWDDGMEAAVRAVFGGGVPVGQLMSIDLNGDGVQFDLVEARQAGIRFSQSLPTGPGLLVTNAIDPRDETATPTATSTAASFTS